MGNWKASMQLLFGLGLTFLFFYMMSPFVIPILLGAMAALLCYPPYRSLSEKMPRFLASLVVTLALSLGILIPLGFMFVSGSHRLLGWISRFRFPRAGSVDDLFHHPVLHKLMAAASRFVPVDQEWLQGQVLTVLQSIFEVMSRVIGDFLAGLPGQILVFFVVIISLYFFLIDGSRFLHFLASLSPMDRERSQNLYQVFEKSCRGVVLALFASALTQAALILILFLAFGIPNAVLFGIFSIIMGMVPVVGTAPVTMGAILYLFATEQRGYGIVMIVGAVVIATLDNVVRSVVLKGQNEMHPLLAIVSAFGATSLMGPPGIFLGPIIAAVFVSFLEILSRELRRESNFS